jgi:dCMP deaminase
MNDKYITLYMDIADRVSRMSVARRLMVGSVIVKNNSILSYGWNGMPSGWDNNCEDEIRYPDAHGITLKTKPEVLHSESNALAKVAKSTESSDGATMFCTHAPCMQCAKLIYQSGIKSLYYRTQYRDTAGIEFLTRSNVDVHQHGI